MTQRTLLAWTLLLAALAAAPARAQANKVAPPAKAKADLHQVLVTEIETRDFTNPMTLRDALGLLFEKMNAQGVEVPILINKASFRQENPDAPDPHDAQVSLPALPRTLSVGVALEQLVDQISHGGMILLRNGSLEIVSRSAGRMDNLLWQKVVVKYHGTPLQQALAQLSDKTGVSIVLDPRAKERVKAPIDAEFRGDVDLESALRMVAGMADLKVVLLDRGVFVTTPEQAAIMERELQQRRENRKEPDAEKAAQSAV